MQIESIENLSLQSLVDFAGECYGNLVVNIAGLAKAYTVASAKFGREGRRAFRNKFPVFTNSIWRTLENIGNGYLLPQFFFYTDKFTNGILRLDNSMDKQRMLEGIVKNENGRDCIEFIERDKDGSERRVLRELATLSTSNCDALLFGVNAARVAEDIISLAFTYRLQMKEQSESKERYEFHKTAVVVNRKCSISKQEWLHIAEKMGWIDSS